MHIRIATSLDQENIYRVHWSAFAEDEREIVSKLAVNLFSEETTPQTISFVAETENAIVGHVAFSPVIIGSNKNFQGYILAPLGVKPDYQKRRIGSKLIERGMQQLSRMGVDILFVYGDPKYYSRFGFSVDAAKCYIPPHRLEYPFGWQSIALSECNIIKSSIKIACVTSLCDPTLW
jgi:putative acetyltransferase